MQVRRRVSEPRALASGNSPKVVGVSEAKTTLSRLVRRAAAGEKFLIAKRGKPIAMLTRLPGRLRRKLPWDVFKGKIKMAEDFDAPLREFNEL